MNLAKFACLLLTAASLVAAGTPVSPDGRYRVEYLDALPHESNVRFLNARSGKVIGHAISYGYEPERFLETAWSPDSRYLAVVSRGTKTTSDLTVFVFHGDSVE